MHNTWPSVQSINKHSKRNETPRNMVDVLVLQCHGQITAFVQK